MVREQQPNITGAGELREWLTALPRPRQAACSQIISARAALRIFPLALRANPDSSSILSEYHFVNFQFAVFRSVFIAWCAAKYALPRERYFSSLASNAADNAIIGVSGRVRDAGASAGRATYVAVNSDTAIYASVAATARSSDAAESNSELIWQAVSEDCSWLLEHDTSDSLINEPLWMPSIGDIPFWISEPLNRFAEREEVRSGPWQLVVDWYQAVLLGSSESNASSFFGTLADIAVATQPNEFWLVTDDRLAEDVLEDIAEIVDSSLYDRDGSGLTSLSIEILSFLDEDRGPVSAEKVYNYLNLIDNTRNLLVVEWRLAAMTTFGRVVRLKNGLYIHPRWYDESYNYVKLNRDNEIYLANDVEEALQNVEAQAPAAYRFRWQLNQLEAAPPTDIASDPEGAGILLSETRRKAEFLVERLERSNADKRVLTSVQGFLSVLTENVADLRPALLRSRARSVEADARAYSSPGDEEQFLYPDALAALIDLSETARDLQGYFPSLRELEAEITALAIEPSEAEAVKARLDEIVDEAAGHPEVVGPSAVEALRKMAVLASEPAPPAVRQKRIADYALVVRNSISSVVLVALDNAFSREAKQLASDIYDKARVKVVEGIAEGAGAVARPATIIAISSLIGAVFGPVAGIASAAAGFGKVDRLLKLADKWLEKWEKENASADSAENEEAAKTAAEADDETRGSAT